MNNTAESTIPSLSGPDSATSLIGWMFDCLTVCLIHQRI